MVAQNFRYDLWSQTDPIREDELIEVHCFIPNGNYIVFKCPSKTTLFELKEVNNK